MVTMVLDHVGYWDNIAPLRAVGRLAMPLYCILFVISVRKNQVNGLRLFIIAAISQIPFMLYIEEIQLNIIFGFFFFYWLVTSQQKKAPLQTVLSFIVIVITGLPLSIFPEDSYKWYHYATSLRVSYGWYLYATLFIFYRLQSKVDQRFAFAVFTGLYVWITRYAIGFPRQLIAIAAPFIDWIKLPRPNKYLYRYFYPGHLMILAIIKISLTGFTFGVFNGFWFSDELIDNAWQTTTSYEPNSLEELLDTYYWNTDEDVYFFEETGENQNDQRD